MNYHKLRRNGSQVQMGLGWGTRIIIIIALMVIVRPRLYPGVGYLQGFHTAFRLLRWGPGSTCLFGFRCRRSGAAADDDDVRGGPKTDLRTLNLLEIQIRLSNFSAATSSFAASCAVNYGVGDHYSTQMVRINIWAKALGIQVN